MKTIITKKRNQFCCLYKVVLQTLALFPPLVGYTFRKEYFFPLQSFSGGNCFFFLLPHLCLKFYSTLQHFHLL